MTDAELREALARGIKDLRTRADLSQRELAKKSGVSDVTISRIERRELSPTIETLAKVAAGLDLQLGALFDAVAPREPSMRARYSVSSGQWSDMCRDLLSQVVLDLGSKARAAAELAITPAKLSRMLE